MLLARPCHAVVRGCAHAQALPLAVPATTSSHHDRRRGGGASEEGLRGLREGVQVQLVGRARRDDGTVGRR